MKVHTLFVQVEEQTFKNDSKGKGKKYPSDIYTGCFCAKLTEPHLILI